MKLDKEYIKMCEKAVEVQEEWKPSLGDFFFGLGDKELWSIGDCECYGHDKNRMNTLGCGCCTDGIYGENIWLPRQDQLQDMVGGGCPGLTLKMLCTVCGFNGSIDPESPKFSYDWGAKYSSMEQLWLAYVMEVKYNKTWNGEEWVIK